MTKNSELEVLIGWLVAKFDDAMTSADHVSESRNQHQARIWKQYTAGLDAGEANRKLTQKVLEHFLHGMLYDMTEHGGLRMQIRDEAGNWSSLEELTGGEAHGLVLDWLRERSAYGSVTLDCVDLSLKS
jgi:hypothetical protein